MTNKERMSQIGEVMDELVKLGFNFEPFCNEFDDDYSKIHFDLHKLSNKQGDQIVFFNDYISTFFGVLEYTSPTWQEDLINRVKELINK